MTENEKKSIYGLNFLKEKLYNGIYADRLDCIDYAISALEEIQKYREIGTVTECREAMEKYRPKKCAIEPCPDHTHYKCPTCMAVHMTVYKPNGPKIGWIPRFCKWCGQAIDDENLERTE